MNSCHVLTEELTVHDKPSARDCTWYCLLLRSGDAFVEFQALLRCSKISGEVGTNYTFICLRIAAVVTSPEQSRTEIILMFT